MKTVNPLPFVDYVHAVCSDLKERGCVRSSETHEAMLRRFLEFSDNPKILMSDLNAKMVEGYEAFLRIQHGVCRNTSSFYLRILRSVCGKAVKEGILPTDDFFRNVYTGVDKTTKRAISLSDIERIRNLDLSHEPAVALARDLFLFSFYMRGMSFIDMAYLTKEARRMLDEAGWESCSITCSNSLDEYIIQDLLLQGARIDSFGVGERLITARSEPVFGGVYKLVAVERESGEIVPKIKVSENVAKITIPHFKKFYRFYDRTNGKALADYLCLYDETPDDTKPLTIFHPENTWKRKTLTNFRAENMMVPVFCAGRLVYTLPSLEDIRKRCAEQLETLWPEVLRFENPHGYYVDLSDRLWNIRHDLLVNAGHSQIPEKQ